MADLQVPAQILGWEVSGSGTDWMVQLAVGVMHAALLSSVWSGICARRAQKNPRLPGGPFQQDRAETNR
jgi:hypothetical protein